MAGGYILPYQPTVINAWVLHLKSYQKTVQYNNMNSRLEEKWNTNSRPAWVLYHFCILHTDMFFAKHWCRASSGAHQRAKWVAQRNVMSWSYAKGNVSKLHKLASVQDQFYKVSVTVKQDVIYATVGCVVCLIMYFDNFILQRFYDKLPLSELQNYPWNRQISNG